MSKFLDLDSPVIRFLNRMADLLILNLLMIAMCIPIITIGASFTAMHYVLLKMVRGEEGYLIRSFFKSFKMNFRQATLIWLMMLAVIGVMIGDVLIMAYSGLQFPRFLLYALIAFAVLFALVVIYVFPLLARFENTIVRTIKNALIITFVNLPKSLLMLLYYAVPLLVIYFVPYFTMFVFFFGISLPAYGSALLYSGIFKKFEPEVEEKSDFDFSIEMENAEVRETRIDIAETDSEEGVEGKVDEISE